MPVLNAPFQVRQGTQAEFAAYSNLQPGELAYTTDQHRLYVGTDGNSVEIARVQDIANGIVAVSSDTIAEPGCSHLFITYADITLPVADNGAQCVFAVDHAVDLTVDKCRVLAPSGETIATDKGLADVCNIVALNQEYRFIRVDGGWRV